jgi:hypothetical protein
VKGHGQHARGQWKEIFFIVFYFAGIQQKVKKSTHPSKHYIQGPEKADKISPCPFKQTIYMYILTVQSQNLTFNASLLRLALNSHVIRCTVYENKWYHTCKKRLTRVCKGSTWDVSVSAEVYATYVQYTVTQYSSPATINREQKGIS